jgi:hypothetical protein
VPAAAIALGCAIASAGCGLGAGAEVGVVEITVTRDYGAVRMFRESERRVAESETVMRLLDRNAEIETRYGGGFVESINGVEGEESAGRLYDWFFYVNGVESSIGAGDYELRDGDRVWWDRRDWSAAMRVPAVVGSFPEPLVHGYGGERHPVSVSCLAAAQACAAVRASLRKVGAEASGGSEPIRVLVGTWKAVSADDAAELIEKGPQASGVFAEFHRTGGGFELRLLDASGEPRRRLRDGAGLVAATRDGESPPTWVVTGTDGGGVAAAVRLLGEARLRDHYAVAASGSRSIPVPFP